MTTTATTTRAPQRSGLAGPIRMVVREFTRPRLLGLPDPAGSRLVIGAAQSAGHAAIRVLPPLCPLSVSAADFSKAADLIRRPRDATARWFDAGERSFRAPELFWSLHRHPSTATPLTDDHACGELVA